MEPKPRPRPPKKWRRVMARACSRRKFMAGGAGPGVAGIGLLSLQSRRPAGATPRRDLTEPALLLSGVLIAAKIWAGQPAKSKTGLGSRSQGRSRQPKGRSRLPGGLTMRLGIVVVALWPFLGLCSSARQEPAPSPPQERLLGGWVNVDKDTGGLKRLAVTKGDGTWSIEAWGAGGGGEIPWGKTSLALLGGNAGARELPYGFATWDARFKVTHLTLRLEKDELVVETFSIFTDKSGRSNYRSVERFKKE